MNLCSDTHDEVCYEGRKCPVCEKIGKITDLEREIDDLKAKITDLEKEETE